MKNFNFNRRYMEISAYTLCVILLALILGKIVWNIVGLGQFIHGFLKFAQGVMAPFIYGFFFAYFMNTTVRTLERSLFAKIPLFAKRARATRFVAVALTYVLYIGCVIWIISYLVPEVLLNLSTLLSKLPTDVGYYQKQFLRYLGSGSALAQMLESLNIPLIEPTDVKTLIDRLVQPITGGLANITNVFNAIFSGTLTFAQSLLNVILGLVIAFYMLCDKEKYQESTKKILRVIFKRRKTAEGIMRLASRSNEMVERFIVGKAIDSTIIGLMSSWFAWSCARLTRSF
jgi:predicted PurR-regulated permease PerM